MSERFVSEAIHPVEDSFDTSKMSIGTPGLPMQFMWRGQKVTVTKTLRTWRTTGPCTHGSGEEYARRHWFEIQTAEHGTMKIYFNRSQPGRQKEIGWWLYTVNA